MLEPEEKKEMLEDARSQARRHGFAVARRYSRKPLSWEEYLEFLNEVQHFFPWPHGPHKITGNQFKI